MSDEFNSTIDRSFASWNENMCSLFQYYGLYYTMNTSIPFDQWSHTIVRTYPVHVLNLAVRSNQPIFVRVASVNAKGSILSDFHIINRSLLHHHLISLINNFHCSYDNRKQHLTIQWSIDYESRFYVHKYLLYYFDTIETNDDLIRQWTIPMQALSIQKQQTHDLYNYELNSSLLDLNYNSYHILRLHLAAIDQNENQMGMTQPAIYCTITSRSGRRRTNANLNR